MTAAAPAPAPVPAPATNPGKGISIAGVVFAFLIPILGLILSIVGVVQSRRAGFKGGLGIAGIIISIVWPIIVTIIIVSAVSAGCSSGAMTCTVTTS